MNAEEKIEIVKNLYEKFENRLNEQFDCLEVKISKEFSIYDYLILNIRNYVIELYFVFQSTLIYQMIMK